MLLLQNELSLSWEMMICGFIWVISNWLFSVEWISLFFKLAKSIDLMLLMLLEAPRFCVFNVLSNELLTAGGCGAPFFINEGIGPSSTPELNLDILNRPVCELDGLRAELFYSI